ncbi:helix-turn-helix transcriptional regulator [Planctomonas sp. JC2975]|nr:helix-turn-helix transcriptional regulator [Planctomonas sp. JC2975]
MAGFRAQRSIGDLQVVPYPAVTLFLDLGDAPVHVDDGDGRTLSGSVAIGLAPKSLRGHGSDVECLQVRLSPLLAHAIGMPSEFGSAAAVTDVWGRPAARLESRLRHASSWEQRFALVAEAVASLASGSGARDPEVAQAWRRLVVSHGSARVEALAAEVGWSRKRLWSRFRAQTGLTPKGAGRLIRFDRAVHRLARGSAPGTVAAEVGYADQSHLSREVADFTGSTPSAIATAPWLDVDDVAWRNPGYTAV